MKGYHIMTITELKIAALEDATAAAKEQKVALWYGSAASGRVSCFLSLASRGLGRDYHQTKWFVDGKQCKQIFAEETLATL